jgi:LPPG:FO 2-phospho-L-lactate transferase
MDKLKVVALAGGVGGAKLADGLAQVLQPDELTIVVNTGDDFIHLGLNISPDLDTICYTIAGIANPDSGWGRANETWNAFTELKRMGMPDWFQLGDADLATHILRTSYLSEGKTLTDVTKAFCKAWSIRVNIIPMSDDVVRTWIISDQGEMGFQEYFVHRKCKPVIKSIKFIGIENSNPAPGIVESIEQADAVVICPSNPFVSIDPILAVPKIGSVVENKLVVAISPIIGDHALKGPAAKMFSEFAIEPSATAVAQHYRNFLDCLFIDSSDKGQSRYIVDSGIQTIITDIYMRDKTDRGRLASEVIQYIKSRIEVNK